MHGLKRVSMAEEHCALYQITRLMHSAGEMVSVQENLRPVAQMPDRVRNYATKGMRSSRRSRNGGIVKVTMFN